MEIIQVAISVAIACLAVILFLIGLRIVRADTGVYGGAHNLNKSVVAALKGTVPTDPDQTRDYRRVAGLAFDRKRQELIFQGTISHEAVNDVIR